MSHYHFDCFSGLAGDMFLGATIDLGVPLDVVSDAVERLGLTGVAVEARRSRRGGIAGTRFRVLLGGRPVEGSDPEEAPAGGYDGVGAAGGSEPAAAAGRSGRGDAGGEPEAAVRSHHAAPGTGHRSYTAIRRQIDGSGLEASVKEKAIALFARLAEAEAGAHGTEVAEVHFHEVGAVDSIVDLVGAAAVWDRWAPERVTCGPVNVGSGQVTTAHGRLPVPAPATARLLTGVPSYGGPGGELLTPTGAVLLAEMVDRFEELPELRLEAHGYGLGRKEVPGRPNAFRLWRGRPMAAPHEVQVIECEIDDLPGEGFGFLMERLLAAGALDAYFTPVQMKKNRPGTLVTCLARRADLEPLAALLVAESGSLGCRYHAAARFEAEREVVEVDTRFGRIRVKAARFGGRPVGGAPEFEDCRRAALEGGVPWREVYRAALVAFDDAPER